MKHKAKSFIAVLLALCLMMSLGVGALAAGGNESENSGGNTHGDDGPGDGDDKGDGGQGDGGDSTEPRVGEEYMIIPIALQGGSVTANPNEAAEGEEVTLTVTTNPGYRLKSLEIKAGSTLYATVDRDELVDGKYTFKMPGSHAMVQAFFEKVYTITVADSTNGSVTADVKEAAESETITLTVKPDPGYELDEVTVTETNGTGSATVIGKEKFSMPGFNVTVTATFKESTATSSGHTITVKQNEGGTVTLNMNNVTEDADGNYTAIARKPISFTATPDEGYEVVGPKGYKGVTDGAIREVSAGTTAEATMYGFNMPDTNVEIGAEFKEIGEPDPPETYSINVNRNPEAGGTVTVDKQTAQAGDTVTFTVEPAEGYEIGTVVVVGASVLDKGEGKYSFEMPASVATITVNFEAEVQYDITVDNDIANGRVTTEPADRAAAGTTVKLTAEPDTGYVLDKYTVTTGSGVHVYFTGDTFIMPSDNVTVSATFKKVETEPETHKITVSAPNADIYIVGGADREEGEVVSFTVKPDSGYKVMGVWAGTEKLTAVNGVYSFKMPDNTVAIVVECRPLDWPDWSHWHKIDTWSNSVDGGISVGNDADMALAGSEVTFRVWHNYKYDYYDYDVYVLNDRTGNRVSLDYSAYDDEYSFTMPDDDVTIYVYFDYVGTYSITKDVEGDGSIYVRSSADYRDTVWIEASPNAGQSLTSLRVFYGEPWAYGDKGYYGYWDEADVHYSEYWDAYYFTMPADDVVVYARFTDGATVDVIAGDHGDAKVSSRYAEKGDWVYITAYPDEGYEVDSVTVTDSLGRSVKVTELSYDYFLFTMPGTSVDVKVTFRAKDYDVFYDVSRGDWYYKAVRFVHEKGIMEGTGTHYFSPEADLSRGMLATILYRLEGSPAVSGYSGFADVADTAYYAKAVAWAKANGIVNGVTATAYEPDTAVTREELAAILCRYAAFKGKDTAISYDYLAGFSDANTSHVYARPALNWAVAYDIINGQGNGVLAPRATATRAEVAQVLMNYLEVFD